MMLYAVLGMSCVHSDMGRCISRWARTEGICSSIRGVEGKRLRVSNDWFGQHSTHTHARPGNSSSYLSCTM